MQVIVARPRSEAGEFVFPPYKCPAMFYLILMKINADRIKVRRAMESSLQKTAMKIVAIVNRDKDHIPPITTSDQNPFPYKIMVNPQQVEAERGFVGGWS